MINLDEIKSEKYISLETYRKNNQPVRTPVWFVVKDDLIYVVTRSKTGKVKRLKNNLQVKFALCTIKGKVTGEWISGTATILNEEETKKAVKRRDKKYGFMAKISKFLSKSKGGFFAFTIKAD
ncbi:PPOX class F420-dependent oxidoreductase [Candidatus Nitrosopumilus sediminis]|uniref:Pyridoxamine 5'-phosphate oxidase family protein n=1 Tax=Candidatus Nitrosopumilus sediminis TaxID=1229909 RepID=K0BC71_9ARCH|nr:PPOX class F420-dependent oxidoreductase [Candidatus Nitrosopumilus sediminis]AFS83074.1 pyridoxamine 5'-phosphate oxidase family protein [Candidatus Nitrosopumilus sediminis]